MTDFKKVTHIKTGDTYFVIKRDVIECTNGREDKKYVIYCKGIKDAKFFCREQEEFDKKFK